MRLVKTKRLKVKYVVAGDPVPETSSPNGCASAKGGSITTSSRDDLLPHLFLDDLGVDFIAKKATGQTRKVSAIKSKKITKVSVAFSNVVTLKSTIRYSLLKISISISLEISIY